LKIKKQKDDWHQSDAILLSSIDSLIKHTIVNYDYEVPYIAGYSTDGKTIYIDKNLPKFFLDNNKKVYIDKFIILHEVLEKHLLSIPGFTYQYAHQIALRIEKQVVESSKVDWEKYDKFIDRWVKIIDKDYDIPPDLDLTPYIDEHDKKLIDVLKKRIKKPIITSHERTKLRDLV